MRTYLQLSAEEKAAAQSLRNHVLAEHAEWPTSLQEAIAEYVGSTKEEHETVVEHVREMVFTHFSPQAAQDVTAAIYPTAGELVIILEDDTQVILKDAQLISHKSDGVINRRIRGAVRQSKQ
jgi:hypothetical protein